MKRKWTRVGHPLTLNDLVDKYEKGTPPSGEGPIGRRPTLDDDR